MYRTVMVLVSLLVVFSLMSCDDTVAQSASARTTHTAGGGDGIMAINGDPIPAAELLSSTYLRDGIRQFIYFHNLRRIAAEEGVTADPKDIEDHINLLKQRLTEHGDTWEGYLGQLMITEDEYRSNLEESLLQDGIVEKRVGVTEEKMREVWEDQKDKVVAEYMKNNFLPDSERDTVTFEMCHDVLFTKVLRIEGVPILGDLQAELIDTATLEITCMSEEEAKLYEFLILESAKNKTGKPLEEFEAAKDEANKGATGSSEDGSNGSSDSAGAGGVDSSVAGK